jgi:hypothetical protein
MVAQVSIDLLDPTGNRWRTLLTNASQSAGPQTVEWDGRTDQGRLVSVAGDYTVVLTAVEPVSGLSATYRGIIVVYR